MVIGVNLTLLSESEIFIFGRFRFSPLLFILTVVFEGFLNQSFATGNKMVFSPNPLEFSQANALENNPSSCTRKHSTAHPMAVKDLSLKLAPKVERLNSGPLTFSATVL